MGGFCTKGEPNIFPSNSYGVLFFCLECVHRIAVRAYADAVSLLVTHPPGSGTCLQYWNVGFVIKIVAPARTTTLRTQWFGRIFFGYAEFVFLGKSRSTRATRAST
jgi:type III secretory pathway component EscS